MQQPGMGGHAPPPPTCKSKVELRVSCRNLLDKDLLSKSDPLCALYILRNGRWCEAGRTEMVLNNLNPDFTKTFVVDYYFEEVQKLLFSVYDIDNATDSLDDDDFLGSIQCTLGHLVSRQAITQPLVMKNGRQAGKSTITISSEELSGSNEYATMQFKGSHLDKKDFFGKSDPYLEIFRQTPDGKWVLTHRTEVIKNTLNPVWKPFKVSLVTLCGANYDSELLMKVWDWDSDGSSDFIGEFKTTFRRFLESSTSSVEWDCINPAKRKKKGSKYKNSGVISLLSCKVETEYSFLDYIMGGCEINFTVAIDFTASNGDPRNPQSLHFMNPNAPNEYLRALRAVGQVCQDYDTDKMFPGLGFGARIPPQYVVHHEFPLNFNYQNPFCAGVAGLEAAYQSCIYQVQLYGPTNFAPVINHVARFADGAARENSAKSYYILLILTDGVISDFIETKDAIVAASYLPMSIIIVGVGRADFSEMDILDGDEVPLISRHGQRCARDIVQFVPFRDFERAPPSELAKCVLAELPDQVTAFFRSRGIKPLRLLGSATPSRPPPASGK